MAAAARAEGGSTARRSRHRFLAFGALCVTSARASAYDARVDASFDAQFYSLRSPFGDPIVTRRRATSTLGLELDRLEGGERGRRGATLAFRSRLRVDADFGIGSAELDPTSPRFVPGLESAPLDLMYAYFEGRGFVNGAIGFRLGRQYVVDAMGFWSFDGALVRLTLPVPFELSGFAGFEQRSGLPMLATPRFSAQGVFRGNRDALEADEFASYLDDAALAPAVGAALESANLEYFQARLSYRAVQNRSTVLVSPYTDGLEAFATISDPRTSSERAAASARLDVPELGALSAQGVYDVYVDAVSNAAVAIDWYTTRALTLGADVEYDLPTFDGDSIFNWFTHRGSTTAQARASYAPSRSFDAGLRGGVRAFETEGDPDDFARPLGAEPAERRVQRELDALGQLGVRARFGPTSVAFHGSGELGARGHFAGADVTAQRTYAGGRYDSRMTLSLYDWSDSLRESRDATSFAYVLGAGLRPGLRLMSAGRLGVEWEHVLNRLVAQRFRLLVTLEFSVLE